MNTINIFVYGEECFKKRELLTLKDHSEAQREHLEIKRYVSRNEKIPRAVRYELKNLLESGVKDEEMRTSEFNGKEMRGPV